MEQNTQQVERVYRKYTDYSLEMHTKQGPIESRLLRGRALLNSEEYRLTFVENEERYIRSKQIHRTEHARLAERPDGGLVLTFRFKRDDKYPFTLAQTLKSEMREMMEVITNKSK